MISFAEQEGVNVGLNAPLDKKEVSPINRLAARSYCYDLTIVQCKRLVKTRCATLLLGLLVEQDSDSVNAPSSLGREKKICG